MEPSHQIKSPRQPWTVRDVLPWLAVVLLAIGIFLQHRRLEALELRLMDQTDAAGKAAEKRMIDRLAPLKDRIDQAERRVKGCIDAVEKSGP